MLLIWNKKLLVRLVINTFCSICTIDSFIIIIDLVSYLCCGILCTFSVRFWMHYNKISLFVAIWSIFWLAMIFFDLFCHNNLVCATAHILVCATAYIFVYANAHIFSMTNTGIGVWPFKITVPQHNYALLIYNSLNENNYNYLSF